MAVDIALMGVITIRERNEENVMNRPNCQNCDIRRKNKHYKERIEKLSNTILSQRNELRLLNKKQVKAEPILQAYIDKYGEEAQARMAIEEMSELTKEICKRFRGDDNLDHIAEEIADVEIMLDQLKMMFVLEEKTKAYRKYKIKRMVERIGDNG
ncbi:MAG: hypothetical protein ACI4LC_05960 [Emergencia sp.]